ncbi:hypothetical protein [Lysobacter sp. GCM10012299]|uniref:hypothetical protein n=1 Tax=Lysobacter sp. GCM10012299 TaxID=3317333 RepID=UPI0036115867
MPQFIEVSSLLKPGDIYEDPFFHPCLCVGEADGAVWGISLIDGSYPRTTDVSVSGVRLLSPKEAWEWKSKGPDVIAAQWREKHGALE